MHNLRRILEQRWSFQQATVTCFVHFASAFDSVERDSLWRIMAVDEMPPKLLRLIKAYHVLTKMKVRTSGSDSMPSEIRSRVRQGCALFNYIIEWILGQILRDYTGVQVGGTVHVSDLAHADDILILSSSYSGMQGLLEAVKRHVAAEVMRINASKAKVMPALIPGKQRQAVLLDGEPLEDVDKFKYLGSMLVTNDQGTEEIRSRINLARSPLSRLQSCFWSTKGCWRYMTMT